MRAVLVWKGGRRGRRAWRRKGQGANEREAKMGGERAPSQAAGKGAVGQWKGQRVAATASVHGLEHSDDRLGARLLGFRGRLVHALQAEEQEKAGVESSLGPRPATPAAARRRLLQAALPSPAASLLPPRTTLRSVPSSTTAAYRRLCGPGDPGAPCSMPRKRVKAPFASAATVILLPSVSDSLAAQASAAAGSPTATHRMREMPSRRSSSHCAR